MSTVDGLHGAHGHHAQKVVTEEHSHAFDRVQIHLHQELGKIVGVSVLKLILVMLSNVPQVYVSIFFSVFDFISF